MNRIIFHIDVNSAFLSWEATYRLHHLGGNLDLRKVPSVINGSVESRHGIILAASIPAKKFGIRTGEPLVDAKRKCPHLYTAPPNYNLYQQCSHSLMDLLREYSPHLEQYSIDEAFLDVTTVCHTCDSPLALAETIRTRIYKELGFTVNIGVSTNKLLAKMASDFKKPNLVHSLFPDEVPQKMWPLPVQDLFFVGRSSSKKLTLLGIFTIGELAHSDLTWIESHFKKHGTIIWNYANGIDASPVVDIRPTNKGYGNSTTIAFDVVDSHTAKTVLLALCETVATRLRKAKVKAEVVSIGIKSFDLQYQSKQLTLTNGTDITKELYHYACQLFDELWDGTPIRHLGVHTSRVKEEQNIRQMNLFDFTNYDKYERLDKTIDDIRTRFGLDAIKRATFLDSPIDHLSGGITREKRSVNYSELDIL